MIHLVWIMYLVMTLRYIQYFVFLSLAGSQYENGGLIGFLRDTVSESPDLILSITLAFLYVIFTGFLAYACFRRKAYAKRAVLFFGTLMALFSPLYPVLLGFVIIGDTIGLIHGFAAWAGLIIGLVLTFLFSWLPSLVAAFVISKNESKFVN